MKQPKTKVSTSYKETINFGKEIIASMPETINLIILRGAVGSGKTTLVKGMASKLGVKEEILSPAYGYKKEYDNFVHYDLYLVKKMKSKELFSLISEELEKKLVIIEWGEKIPKMKNSLDINIKTISETARTIEACLV